MPAPSLGGALCSPARSRHPLRLRTTGREPRPSSVCACGIGPIDGPASGDDRGDRRLTLTAGTRAARERGGDVVQRPDQPHLLLPGQVAAWRRVGIHRGRAGWLETGYGIRGQPVPRSAEHLQSLLLRGKVLGRGPVSSMRLGGAMESVGGLDQRRGGILRRVSRRHSPDGGFGAPRLTWVLITKQRSRIDHLRRAAEASRGPPGRAGSRIGSARPGYACRASRARWHGGGRRSSC
jgi:hypothetical protein